MNHPTHITVKQIRDAIEGLPADACLCVNCDANEDVEAFLTILKIATGLPRGGADKSPVLFVRLTNG